MAGEPKQGGQEHRRRNRAAKDLTATRQFWMPDLESEARRLEEHLTRKLSGAEFTVRVERGHLVIYDHGLRRGRRALAPQRQLRLTPINTGIYRLSYFRHTGRWWPLSYAGTIKELASTVASHLAPWLEMKWAGRGWAADAPLYPGYPAKTGKPPGRPRAAARTQPRAPRAPEAVSRKA